MAEVVDFASPERQSTLVSSSLPTSADSKGLRDPRKNPIFTIVNDYYAKQQQAYMAKKARQLSQQAPAAERNMHSIETDEAVDKSTANTSSTLTTEGTAQYVSVPGTEHHTSNSVTRRSRAEERLQDWAEMRDSALELARREANNSLASALSFQPNLERARHDLVPPDASVIGHNELQTSIASSSLHNRTGDLTERLQEQARQAQERLVELRRKRNQELGSECTFVPQTTVLAQEVASKVGDTTEALRLRQADSDYRRIEEDEGLDDECTFHPVIGDTSRRIFEASRVDDEHRDVYDRLYSKSIGALMSKVNLSDGIVRPDKKRPEKLKGETGSHRSPVQLQDIVDEHIFYEMSVLRQNFAAEQESSTVPFMETFLRNVLAENYHRLVETSFASKRWGTPVSSSSNANRDSHESASARNVQQQQQPRVTRPGETRSFDEFLERQSRAFQGKLERVDALARVLAPTHTPHVCQHSLQLVRERPTGFATHGRSGSLPSRRTTYVDPCTFRPVITKAGESASPRGVEDLYRDAERRREKITERMRTKESASMDGVTFKPTTNSSKNVHVESLLTPKNLDKYKEQVERQRLLAEARKRKHDEQSLENEVLECTFHPQTNRTPSYISRMASSFAIVRETDAVQ